MVVSWPMLAAIQIGELRGTLTVLILIIQIVQGWNIMKKNGNIAWKFVEIIILSSMMIYDRFCIYMYMCVCMCVLGPIELHPHVCNRKFGLKIKQKRLTFTKRESITSNTYVYILCTIESVEMWHVLKKEKKLLSTVFA